MKRKQILKVTACFIAVSFMWQIFFPTIAYALTSGPGSPEFSSFEPVATTDMVNVFSGDFTYNLPVLEIPGSDGGGYALSLSYHSGGSSDEEASWVGFGWSLNPGAINRNVRGLPDEYNNKSILKYNKTRPNWSLSATHKLNLEFFSQEEMGKTSDPGYSPQSKMVSFQIGTALRFNNYQGFARSYTMGPSFKGFGSLSMQISSSGITFSADINPLGILNKLKGKANKDAKAPTALEKLKTEDRAGKGLNKVKFKDMMKSGLSQAKSQLNGALGGSAYGLAVFNEEVTNMSVAENKGYNLNFSLSLMIPPSFIPVGINLGTTGSFSMQSNIPETTEHGYGYLHTQSSGGEGRVEDYYVEKGGSFDKRDFFLGVPFSNPDMFTLTGEGLSGGFRLHNPEAGHYFPSQSVSKLKIYNIGFQLTLGQDLGVGLTFGFGLQNTKMQDWETDSHDFSGNSTPVFSFQNDPGSKFQYGTNAVEVATVYKQPNFPGIASGHVDIGPSINSLEYYPNATDPKYGTSSSIKSFGNLDGFDIYNADGAKYKYGNTDPSGNNCIVRARCESNLSVDAIGASTVDNNNYITTARAMHLSGSGGQFALASCEHKVALGEIKNEPYITSYLLNEITTPDYVDTDGDGADDNDFGGWTRFRYFKDYGENNDNTTNTWYRWRMPYNGLLYQKNQISDLKDDVASVTTGEKELCYLKQIETKTHVAYFVTNESDYSRFEKADNSGTHLTASDPEGNYLSRPGTRSDGRGAVDLTSEDPAATDAASMGSSDLERLEKIVVFAKNRMDKPIKTIYFEYYPQDESLVKGLPNCFGHKGKLTLKKVWSEFDGTVGAKISPYEFVYRYKNSSSFEPEVIANNPGLTDFFDLNTNLSDAAQNRDYQPHSLDAWGNIQVHGEQQYKDMRTGLFQGRILPGDQFDPASWQLKQIKLPSGGEILVQYEQKDYQYVQDKRATALVSLKTVLDDAPDTDHAEYEVNCEDIGMTDAGEISNYAAYLRDYFDVGADEPENNHIYFKFLYALEDYSPSLDDCKSEYIDGYAKVSDVQPGGAGVIITLNGAGSTYDGYNMTPRQGCYDFYSTNRVGKYEMGCEGYYEHIYDATATDIAEKDFCENLWSTGLTQIIQKFAFATVAIIHAEVNSVPDLRIQPPSKSEVCKTLNTHLSYFKLPMPHPKRGGGIRVKRLLMYDPGIEDTDASLYGSVYKYELPDGTSSGVATTEPAKMRNENALVDFLPKKRQSWVSRHIVGADKEQAEGPIGESLLPGASIGHSRVVVQNIHTGKTGTGYTVHEFFTVKDYPFDKMYNYSALMPENPNSINDRKFDFAGTTSESGVTYTNLADNTHKDWMNLPTGVFNYSHKKIWTGQDFRFIVNQMHGQPRSVKQYYGNPTDPDPVLSSSTNYYYYEPGEQVRMLKYDASTGNKSYVWDTPGKEMDLTMESKTVHTNSLDFGLSVDLSVGLIFWPPIFVTFFPSISLNDQKISTHTSSKVINYPVMQRAVENFKDGIWSKTEYLAFDRVGGKPILTRTTDSFDGMDPLGSPHDGSYYALNEPAHWYYSGMGPKYLSYSNSNQLSASAGSITTYGDKANVFDNNAVTYVIGTDGDWAVATDKVINASANTFSTGNSGTTTDWFGSGIHNEYLSTGSQTELEDMWRPHANYVYKTDVLNSSNPITPNYPTGDASHVKIYDGGVYKTPLALFDYLGEYSSGSITAGWIKLNEVTKYSPNGNALEEKNTLNIFSAARYGYQGHSQPVMITQNGEYSSIFFKDYENEVVLLSPNPDAHSGVRYEDNPSALISLTDNLMTTDHLISKGALLKMWIKSELDLSNDLYVTVVGGLSSNIYPQRIARTGVWTLYSFKIKPAELPSTAGNSIEISVASSNANPFSVDDVRFQPMDAQSTCYVYDIRTLKLITQFDDQHFGMFYQYNGDGKLVRKIIETERGLKTVQETQYNQPSKDRGL